MLHIQSELQSEFQILYSYFKVSSLRHTDFHVIVLLDLLDARNAGK